MSHQPSSRSQSSHTAPQNQASSGSNHRVSVRRSATVAGRAVIASRVPAISSGFGMLWDLAVLDRLQAPLTHYHE